MMPVGKTLEFVPDPGMARRVPIGQVFVKRQQTITLYNEGKSLILPAIDVMIIGRRSNHPEDAQVDVALNPFQAAERGVSRHHVNLRRVDEIIYVSDLYSTNGTFLNGRRLLPQSPAILRHGDELRLGHLMLRVVFAMQESGEKTPTVEASAGHA
jgi:pSer/pThr/pTyr-binding forkhead associated (FHA) protein